MCKMIEGKFDNAGINYEICDNIDEMKKMGISNVPVALIDEELMNAKKILKWLEEI